MDGAELRDFIRGRRSLAAESRLPLRDIRIILENMRPGTLDRLGFPAARLWETDRGPIIGRISGYGQTGPYASKPGFGTLAEAMGGFTYMNAQPGVGCPDPHDPPSHPGRRARNLSGVADWSCAGWQSG